MSENKWVRSISFNKKNPDDIARLKLIGRKKFSKFIKNLLDEELKRQELLPAATTKPATPLKTQQIKPTTTTKPVVPKKQRGPSLINPMLRGRAK